MRIKAFTIKELNEQLAQHPAIRASLPTPTEAKETATAESAASLRRRIHQAMSVDPRIGALVTSGRRVTQCGPPGCSR